MFTILKRNNKLSVIVALIIAGILCVLTLRFIAGNQDSASTELRNHLTELGYDTTNFSYEQPYAGLASIQASGDFGYAPGKSCHIVMAGGPPDVLLVGLGSSKSQVEVQERLGREVNPYSLRSVKLQEILTANPAACS